MSWSKLFEALDLDLDEADLNWKWDQHGRSLGNRQDRRNPDEPLAAKGSRGSAAGSTSADFEPKPDAPEMEPSPLGTARHVVPLPTEGDAGSKNISFGKQNGFKKLGTFLVNPKHWEKGAPNDAGSLNWEGPNWLKPKTPQAKEFMRIVKADKIRATDAWKPEVWKKHFEHKFGSQNESKKIRLREFFGRCI